MIVPGLFIATCFISMAIGTSVGTVVALTPLAVNMAEGAGAPVPFFVAILLGGAFFGDNLSFISDTTIAATRTQGCDMKDKFLANIRIVLPAAAIALFLYCLFSPTLESAPQPSGRSLWLVIPYLIVIACALYGITVTVVLLIGIISAMIAAILEGISILDIFSIAGEGIDSVGPLVMITLLAAGMLGMIKSAGGIDFILKILGRNISTSRGAQLSISLLVGIVNLCTANNTVAILTVGSLAKKSQIHIISHLARPLHYLIPDLCIVQAIIPYGAQTLMAASLAGISPIGSLAISFLSANSHSMSGNINHDNPKAQITQ